MGSFVAIISCCNIDIDTTFLKMTYELASNFENNLYNNIFSMGKQLRDIIEQCLPSNAYELASVRCFIVITTLSTNGLQQEIISEFYSQDDLWNNKELLENLIQDSLKARQKNKLITKRKNLSKKQLKQEFLKDLDL